MSQDGRTIRCPMCRRRTTWRENPHRPFCSARCRSADLEGWLTGRYVVTGDAETAVESSCEADLAEGQGTPEVREKT
jgi:endogenous inhibitor of DNA gyrase (YacG/DUF329 family)